MVTPSVGIVYSGNGCKEISAYGFPPKLSPLQQTPSRTICPTSARINLNLLIPCLCDSLGVSSQHELVCTPSRSFLSPVENYLLKYNIFIPKLPNPGKPLTSTGVASTMTRWMASIKTPGLALANPTAHIACSSPLYSGHCPSLHSPRFLPWHSSHNLNC
jgi:hypothetical protein